MYYSVNGDVALSWGEFLNGAEGHSPGPGLWWVLPLHQCSLSSVTIIEKVISNPDIVAHLLVSHCSESWRAEPVHRQGRPSSRAHVLTGGRASNARPSVHRSVVAGWLDCGPRER